MSADGSTGTERSATVSLAGWQSYASALAQFHDEREQAAGAGRVSALDRAEREACMADFTARLAAQRDRILALAADLRAPLRAADLSPAEAPRPEIPRTESTDNWRDVLADLLAHLELADRTAVETRVIGALPQLLPNWRSALARNTVVYFGLSLPNTLFTTALSLAGVTGNTALLTWFVVIFPTIAAVGGGILIGDICRPRLRPRPHDGADLGPPEPRRTRHRPLAVLVAWASWLVPGVLLDALAPHMHR